MVGWLRRVGVALEGMLVGFSRLWLIGWVPCCGVVVVEGRSVGFSRLWLIGWASCCDVVAELAGIRLLVGVVAMR